MSSFFLHFIQTSQYSGTDDGLLASRKYLISFDLNFNLTDGMGEGETRWRTKPLLGVFIKESFVLSVKERRGEKLMNLLRITHKSLIMKKMV